MRPRLVLQHEVQDPLEQSAGPFLLAEVGVEPVGDDEAERVSVRGEPLLELRPQPSRNVQLPSRGPWSPATRRLPDYALSLRRWQKR